jgi:hypothetical protein
MTTRYGMTCAVATTRETAGSLTIGLRTPAADDLARKRALSSSTSSGRRLSKRAFLAPFDRLREHL